MELSYRFVDLDKTQQTTHGYADIIPREGPTGKWYVPKLQLLSPEQQWQLVQHGKLVEVPLVPYVINPDMSHLFGFAVQLGIIVRAAFDGHDIKAMRLSIGTPCAEVVSQDKLMWRAYFGVAILLN